MKVKLLFASFLFFMGLLPMGAQTKQQDMNGLIDNLMSQMTLQEKLGQLNLPVTGDIVTGQAKSSDVAGKIRRGEVGGLFNLKGVESIRELQKLAVEQSRLKIPLLFGMDVIHGYETVFPIPFALSCSWDMEAVERSARIAAQECSADGICWTFSPMVDIARDPRWGRMAEGNGEDPYLGAAIARAMVHGYQGDDLTRNNTVMACVKHFALYGAAEAGRDYNTVDMSHWRMFNYYFPPYEAAAKAGAGSFMTSFNVVDGIPATGNKWLLTDVLRKMWGWNGFVVTDYTAIAEMTAHGLGDLQTVSAMALNAGTDMDMVADGFIGTLEQSLREGKVSEAAINQACRRILEAKYKLGLFDDPYRYLDKKRAAKEIYTAENRAEARRIAAETFVLLKNDDGLLPLQKKGKIALIGPLANTSANMPGTWSVAAAFDKYKSLYYAMLERAGDDMSVVYAKGCNIMDDAKIEANGSFGKAIRDNRSSEEMLNEALEVADDADVIVAAIGETSEMTGESSSRSDLTLPDAQKRLLEALKDTGKPIVLVNFSGRATVMTWESDNFSTLLNVWFGGSEAADAICDVLFGDKVPSGKLTATMPKSVGQIPLYYNHLNTGRPLEKGAWFAKFRSNYLDIDNEPLYPFGYGLSYTTFRYGPLRLSGNSMDRNGKITASVDVTNTGSYDGDEVVQMYIRDLVGSVSRPVMELKGFERIHLKKGETKTVTFEVSEELLRFYNSQLEYVSEPGDFEVMVGPNSRDVQKASFSLTASAQTQNPAEASDNDSLNQFLSMLNNMTDEQKAYARANWLMPPVAYVNKHDHPASFVITPNPAPDTQTGNECAACASAYLLRFYGEDVNGVALYQQPTFPCKYSDGAYPKCFKMLFEEQCKNYTADYYTGTIDDLKDAVGKGIPVIVLVYTGHSLHYVPVVGYDEKHIFIQDSVEDYRNVTGNNAYNESVDIDTFDKMWNIPIESCQRLFVVVKKR